MPVDTGDSHYAFLGVDPSASDAQLESALQRVIDQADILAYSSPQGSYELWERIRRVRRDVLSDPSRRAAYDQSLLEAHQGSVSVGRERRDRLLGVAVGVAVVLGFGALFAGIYVHSSTAASKPKAATIALSSSGPRTGAAYDSGQSVTLQWTAVPQARQYRLQVAASPDNLGDSVIFNRPLRSIITREPHYAIKVLGAQMYYWRVQSLIHGKWTRFTASQLFAVAPPAVPVPVPLRPANGTTLSPGPIQVCWSQVPGAVEYHLQVSGAAASRTTSPCTWLSTAPGRYTWRVAASVRAAHAYTGGFSRPASFTVRAVASKRKSKRV